MPGSVRSVAGDFCLVLVGRAATATLVAVILLCSLPIGSRPGGPAEGSAGALAERSLTQRIVPAMVPASAGSLKRLMNMF